MTNIIKQLCETYKLMSNDGEEELPAMLQHPGTDPEVIAMFRKKRAELKAQQNNPNYSANVPEHEQTIRNYLNGVRPKNPALSNEKATKGPGWYSVTGETPRLPGQFVTSTEWMQPNGVYTGYSVTIPKLRESKEKKTMDNITRQLLETYREIVLAGLMEKVVDPNAKRDPAAPVSQAGYINQRELNVDPDPKYVELIPRSERGQSGRFGGVNARPGPPINIRPGSRYGYRQELPGKPVVLPGNIDKDNQSGKFGHPNP